MTPVQTLISSMLAGEQVQTQDTDGMNDLLQSMRETLRDPVAQRELGLFVLSQISGQIKAEIHTTKAMQSARFTNSEEADDE